MPFVWGTDLVRRDTGIPFLVYEPRPKNAALLLDDARRWGGRVHLVRGERRLTFDELGELVPKATAVLGDHGAGPGDRVMLLAFNSIEWVVGFWAVLAAGGVVVLANAWWSETELQHSLGVVDVQLVLADEHSAKREPAGVLAVDLEDLVTEAGGRSPATLAEPATDKRRPGGHPLHLGDDRADFPREVARAAAPRRTRPSSSARTIRSRVHQRAAPGAFSATMRRLWPTINERAPASTIRWRCCRWTTRRTHA